MNKDQEFIEMIAKALVDNQEAVKDLCNWCFWNREIHNF
jgi:hypothetical protein